MEMLTSKLCENDTEDDIKRVYMQVANTNTDESSEKSNKLTNVKSINSTETELFNYEQFNIVIKMLSDVIIYVVGDFDENEFLLSEVLNTLNDRINYFTKDKTSSTTLLDCFENVMLCIYEMIDEGRIITLESNTIIAKATMQDTNSI